MRHHSYVEIEDRRSRLRAVTCYLEIVQLELSLPLVVAQVDDDVRSWLSAPSPSLSEEVELPPQVNLAGYVRVDQEDHRGPVPDSARSACPSGPYSWVDRSA